MSPTTEERSRIMRAVKGQNTAPEMIVRRLLHKQGFRYRLHVKDLPGKPDIVFPRKKKAIFIHGCFWHGHDCLRGNRVPKTNQEYWIAKVHKNVQRDQRTMAALSEEGWKILILWECDLKNTQSLMDVLVNFIAQ